MKEQLHTHNVSQSSQDSHEHGVIIDKLKHKVKCNYCHKVVGGFYRLKEHLGGICGNVLPCDKVSQEVMVLMRDGVLGKRNAYVNREVLQLLENPEPDVSLIKRENESNDRSNGKRKHDIVYFTQDVEEDVPSLHKIGSSLEALTSEVVIDLESHPSIEAKRNVGKFLYENGMDFSVVMSPSFKKMITSFAGSEFSDQDLPNCSELHGWILQEAKNELDSYVKEVKQSWAITGCSILLDGWINDKGRCFIHFLVDCPRGPIFLRSMDITDSADNVDSWVLLIEDIIEEVGAENVVQVIAGTTLGCMDEVGRQLAEKRRYIFWSVCASHCIGLMLDKIEKMSHVEEVINKAKTIIQFIYNREAVLKLMSEYIKTQFLVNSSRIKSLRPFLTLENIVTEKKNLRNMVRSSTWTSSLWASTEDGINVADLIEKRPFWTEAGKVLKATIPLVRALHLINGGDDKPQMGFIYETMDQIKETVKEELGNKKAFYCPFWSIVDGIWNDVLHSPIHAAGYFLNPGLFYFEDFVADAEVAGGILGCIVRIVEDKKIQDLIVKQLENYRVAKGPFGSEKAIKERSDIHPEKWWSLYGVHCPELQKFAIRILSQTCSGALKYNLYRHLSEELHKSGRNNLEQQRLLNIAFVHHNLRLRDSSKSVSEGDDDMIDLRHDWIVDIVETSSQSNGNNENVGEPSQTVIQPMMELE